MVKTHVKTNKNGKKVNPYGTLFSLAYAASSGYISESYYSQSHRRGNRDTQKLHDLPGMSEWEAGMNFIQIWLQNLHDTAFHPEKPHLPLSQPSYSFAHQTFKTDVLMILTLKTL